jgi:hypothetical protein
VAAHPLADATRFASLAAPALREEEIGEVSIELRRYHELYGIGGAWPCRHLTNRPAGV